MQPLSASLGSMQDKQFGPKPAAEPLIDISTDPLMHIKKSFLSCKAARLLSHPLPLCLRHGSLCLWVLRLGEFHHDLHALKLVGWLEVACTNTCGQREFVATSSNRKLWSGSLIRPLCKRLLNTSLPAQLLSCGRCNVKHCSRHVAVLDLVTQHRR